MEGTLLIYAPGLGEFMTEPLVGPAGGALKESELPTPKKPLSLSLGTMTSTTLGRTVVVEGLPPISLDPGGVGVARLLEADRIGFIPVKK